MEKKKKMIIIILSLIFILIITLGGTFAYLTTVTKETTNAFRPSDNIRARLTEPNWDEDEGLKLVPGKTVHKDPMITNTGQTDEYTAIRLTFQYENKTDMSDSDLIKLLNLIKIDWNSKWKLCEGAMTVDGTGTVTAVIHPLIFYYDEILSTGEISDPIFSSISVKTKSEGLTEADLRWLQAIKIVNGEIVDDLDGLGQFYIKIEGFAVQAVSFTDAFDAAEALKNLFP